MPHHPSATDWLTAIGTCSAVIVALFGNVLRGIVGPRLTLELNDPNSVLQEFDWETSDGQKGRGVAWYYHVRVGNTWRRLVEAHAVQVYLLRIEKLGTDGYQTVWAGHGVPLEWQHQSVREVRPTIGAPLLADILQVRSGLLTIKPLILPVAFPGIYTQQCNLVLTLQARSNERDTDLLRLHVSWDGGWDKEADDMSRHLSIEPIEPADT